MAYVYFFRLLLFPRRRERFIAKRMEWRVQKYCTDNKSENIVLLWNKTKKKKEKNLCSDYILVLFVTVGRTVNKYYSIIKL